MIKLRLAIVLGFGLQSACAPAPLIVAEPPPAEAVPVEEVRLQQEERRAIARPEIFDADIDDPHHDEPFQGPVEDPAPEGFWQIVSDVIGFPFRAIGWAVKKLL